MKIGIKITIENNDLEKIGKYDACTNSIFGVSISNIKRNIDSEYSYQLAIEALSKFLKELIEKYDLIPQETLYSEKLNSAIKECKSLIIKINDAYLDSLVAQPTREPVYPPNLSYSEFDID